MKDLTSTAQVQLQCATASCHHSAYLQASCLCHSPPTKEEVKVFARVRLSVCLLARLLKNACMDLDEMLRLDRCRDTDELINF